MERCRLKKHSPSDPPPRRFAYECVYACHQGTDDAQEFETHLTLCPHIFDGVRKTFAAFKERGERFVLSEVPAAPGDRPGQMILVDAPVTHRKKKRGMESHRL